MTDGSLALTVLRAVISLALVLALLIWCMRVLARRGGFTPSARSVPVDVELLGRKQLSRAASVQVVKVAGRVLVLGVTEAQVSVLSHLSPGDVAADEDLEGNATGPHAPTVSTGATTGSTVATTPALIDALRRQGGGRDLIADVTGRRRGGRHRGGSTE